MSDKSSPTPWVLVMTGKWPFPIQIFDANDVLVSQFDMPSHSTSDKCLADVLAGTSWAEGESRKQAVEANAAKVAVVRRIVASVNLLAESDLEDLEYCAEHQISPLQGGLFSERMKLQRERDELIAAIEGLIGSSESGWFDASPSDEAMNVAKLALAKAKGERSNANG